MSDTAVHTASDKKLAKATLAAALITRGGFPSLPDLDALVSKPDFGCRKEPESMRLRRRVRFIWAADED